MSRNFSPDPVLIDQLRLDDSNAFEEIFHRYSHLLYTYCFEKLASPEDARHIVRDIFVSLWEKRYELPVDFSVSLYLYTEVRRSVVTAVCKKLNDEKDISLLKEHIIPGFKASKLAEAREPVKAKTPVAIMPRPVSAQNNYTEYWWKNLFFRSLNFKQLRYTMQKVMHLW